MNVYAQFEDIYRDEFEKYTGMNTRDNTVKLFTLDEQIDRYSKSLSFWTLLCDKIKLSKKINPDYYEEHEKNLNYIYCMISHNQFKIESIFPLPAVKRILDIVKNKQIENIKAMNLTEKLKYCSRCHGVKHEKHF